MNVTLTCPYCQFSKEVRRENIPPGARRATCPRCGQRFDLLLSLDGPLRSAENLSDGQAEAGGNAESTGTGRQESFTPWEDRGRWGLWIGTLQTLKLVLFKPKAVFSRMNVGSGLREPLAFGLMVGSVGGMFGSFWKFLVVSGGIMVSRFGGIEQATLTFIFLVVMALVPLLVMLTLFLHSGVLHVLLRVTGAGSRGFEATFRVVSYSQATSVWGLVPLLGGLIGGIWQVVVQIIGLREIHETSYLKVIIAFLIPVLFVFFMVMAGLIFLFRYFN